MAGEYMNPDYTPKESANTRTVSGRFEKILKVFIFLAALLLAAELIWILGVSPFKALARIDITGLDGIGSGRISREELYTMAGISPGTSYFSVNARNMERALMNYSFFESVRVYKHFPDRIHIILEGRRAVATAFAQINGITVPVLLDSQGVIFEIGHSGSNGAYSLPVLSGLVIEDPFLGMRLQDDPFMGTRIEAILIPLFRELEQINFSAPELLAAVSEISIDLRAWDGYDLVIYPLHRRIRVQLSELNEDILRYTLLMVDVLASDVHGFREGEINSLDFRSGIASFIPRPREASFE